MAKDKLKMEKSATAITVTPEINKELVEHKENTFFSNFGLSTYQKVKIQ